MGKNCEGKTENLTGLISGFLIELFCPTPQQIKDKTRTNKFIKGGLVGSNPNFVRNAV